MKHLIYVLKSSPLFAAGEPNELSILFHFRKNLASLVLVQYYSQKHGIQNFLSLLS